MMFGSKPKPPPPPPPPPSPPTYASQASVAPTSNVGRFGGLSETILTGPLGTQGPIMTKNKSLLGQ